jgi:hypothetical protein
VDSPGNTGARDTVESTAPVSDEYRGFFPDGGAELAWVRRKIEHEDILVDHRLSWLTTSQAFLAAVYVIRFNEASTAPFGVEVAVPVIGIASSVCIFVSIRAALRAYKEMQRRWCCAHPGRETVLLADAPHTLKKGNTAAQRLPFLFIVAWLAALGYEIAAYVNG